MSINANAIENVILFGDSLMAGYGLPQEKHLAIVLQNNLNDSSYNLQVIDGSVSGSTSAGGLNRVEWSLSQPDIDLMILGLGANDMLRGISPIETEKNLEKIIQTANESRNRSVSGLDVYWLCRDAGRYIPGWTAVLWCIRWTWLR